MKLFFKKKAITGYPRSFAKRLTWRIMLRMIIIMIIPVLLLFWITYGIVALGVTGISDRVLKGEKEEVRRIASDLYMASINTAAFIEDDLSNPDRMHDIINRMVKLNPYMRSCGIYFIENYYPKKGRLFAPYATRRDSTTIIESQNAIDQGNDYVKDEWFKNAIASEKGYWTKPFFDNDSARSPLVSYLLPIRDKSRRAVAVLGVDLSLAWLNEKIQPMETHHATDEKEWDPEYKLYYFMTDSTGTILVHPDATRIVSKNIYDYITKGNYDRYVQMSIEEKLDDDLTIDGEKVLVCAQKVKHTDWTIAIAVPSVVIDIIGYIAAGFAITGILIGMLVVYFFGRRTIKKNVKPLTLLAASADEVAKGNFQTALHGAEGVDGERAEDCPRHPDVDVAQDVPTLPRAQRYRHLWFAETCKGCRRRPLRFLHPRREADILYWRRVGQGCSCLVVYGRHAFVVPQHLSPRGDSVGDYANAEQCHVGKQRDKYVRHRIYRCARPENGVVALLQCRSRCSAARGARRRCPVV